MKRARVLWRRALKKANNPDADLSDSGSFRLGELARIARRQQLEQEELDQTRQEAQDAENEKNRLVEEKIKQEEGQKAEKSGVLPGFLTGGVVRHGGIDQLQTDVRIIERKVDDVISMIERLFRTRRASVSPIPNSVNSGTKHKLTPTKKKWVP